MESKKYSFNKEDLRKIGIGALVAIGGALIPYLTEVLANFEFGKWAFIAAPLSAILLNTLRKWVSGQS